MDELKSCGYDVLFAAAVPDALRMIYHEGPDLIISDRKLPFLPGDELRKLINLQMLKHIPIILFNRNRAKELLENKESEGLLESLKRAD